MTLFILKNGMLDVKIHSKTQKISVADPVPGL